MKKELLCALALLTVSASHASAAIRIDLEGSVYYRSGDAVPVFSNGDKATAWFEYDEKATGTQFYPDDPSIFLYRDAPTGGGMIVKGLSISFSDSARMFVTDQEKASYGPIDRVLFDDFDPKGGDLNGRPMDVVSISWQDNSATALRDIKLPRSQEAYDKFSSVTASIDWAPYINAEHRVSIDFSKVKISRVLAVPEPATWAMMILGFGVVGYSLRKRQADKTVVHFA